MGLFPGGEAASGRAQAAALPSLNPSLRNSERLRRPGAGGRADAGGARVALGWQGRSDLIQLAVRPPPRATPWPARGSAGQLLFVPGAHTYGARPSRPRSSPHFWHLRPHPQAPWPPRKVGKLGLPVGLQSVRWRGEPVRARCVLPRPCRSAVGCVWAPCAVPRVAGVCAKDCLFPIGPAWLPVSEAGPPLCDV